MHDEVFFYYRLLYGFFLCKKKILFNVFGFLLILNSFYLKNKKTLPIKPHVHAHSIDGCCDGERVKHWN